MDTRTQITPYVETEAQRIGRETYAQFDPGAIPEYQQDALDDYEAWKRGEPVVEDMPEDFIEVVVVGDAKEDTKKVDTSAAEVETPARLALLLEKGKTSKWYAMNEAPPIDWIIDYAIESGALVMIYGDSGIGKTFLAMHLAAVVGAGKPWYGRQCKKRKVLYLEAENGEGLIHDRSKMIDPDGQADVTYFSFPEFSLDPEGLDLLRDLIEETGAELVVLDPLMNFMVGDENSVESVRPQIRGLRQLAEETGCAVLLVHHENKAGGYRGSSGFKDLMTLQLHLKVSDVPSEKFEHVLDAIPMKQRRSMLKRFPLVWFVEGGKFQTGALEVMKHSPVTAVVEACQELMKQDMIWPGKAQLVKAKELHGLTQKAAGEALAQAVRDNSLECAIGRANKHEIRVPGYNEAVSSF